MFLTKLLKYSAKIEDVIVVLLNLAAKSEIDTESSCVHLQNQNGNGVTNWLLFNSFLVIVSIVILLQIEKLILKVVVPICKARMAM